MLKPSKAVFTQAPRLAGLQYYDSDQPGSLSSIPETIAYTNKLTDYVVSTRCVPARSLGCEPDTASWSRSSIEHLRSIDKRSGPQRHRLATSRSTCASFLRRHGRSVARISWALLEGHLAIVNKWRPSHTSSLSARWTCRTGIGRAMYKSKSNAEGATASRWP